MLLWLIGGRFENSCTLPGKWSVFKIFYRLYGWVYEILRLNPSVVEHNVGAI